MEADFLWPGRALLGGRRCWALLHGSVAPPEGGQARLGNAPEVVGFLGVVRPALQDGRKPQVRCTWGRGGRMHWKALLLAGRQARSLGHKEYSMVARPSSPLSNTGALSLLSVQIFSQVPSVVAFHSPALSVLLLPPATHCFLILQAVSTLPTPARSRGTNLRSLGLGAQPPPECLGFW